MFGRRKPQQREQRQEERSNRRPHSRESGRRVFGFRCSPTIPASLKEQADALGVPIFALAEHCLQLGAIEVQRACLGKEQTEELRSHLVECHVEIRTIEKLSKYDRHAADMLERERLRRFEIEQATRNIVAKFSRWFTPNQIEALIVVGFRARMAKDRGQSRLPNIPRTADRTRHSAFSKPMRHQDRAAEDTNPETICPPTVHP